MEGICEIVPPSFRKNTKEKNTYTLLFTKQTCFHHNHHHHHHHHHLPRCHFISRKHLLQKLPPKPRKSWSCWTLDSWLCSSQDLYILLSSRWEDYIYLGVYERYMGHSISNHKKWTIRIIFFAYMYIYIYHAYMRIYMCIYICIWINIYIYNIFVFLFISYGEMPQNVHVTCIWVKYNNSNTWIFWAFCGDALTKSPPVKGDSQQAGTGRDELCPLNERTPPVVESMIKLNSKSCSERRHRSSSSCLNHESVVN